MEPTLGPKEGRQGRELDRECHRESLLWTLTGEPTAWSRGRPVRPAVAVLRMGDPLDIRVDNY